MPPWNMGTVSHASPEVCEVLYTQSVAKLLEKVIVNRVNANVG